MRGAPHVGFSTIIRKINSRTSFDVCRLPTGLLTLEISFQYKRNPPLCQRTTVSGVTATRDCCHADQNRRTTTQKSLSSGSARTSSEEPGETPPDVHRARRERIAVLAKRQAD